MATRHEPWPATVVTAVAGVLGDTAHGLTGREIGQLLAAVKVPDADGGNKRDRLAAALLAQQARQGVSNCVIAFIKEAMVPVRYVQQPHTFSPGRTTSTRSSSTSGCGSTTGNRSPGGRRPPR